MQKGQNREQQDISLSYVNVLRRTKLNEIYLNIGFIL